MKKLLLIALLAFGMNARAQITLEHTYNSAATYNFCSGNQSELMIINFEVSGEKYVNVNRCGKAIEIYDMNHAMVKTISLSNMPAQAPPYNNIIEDILYLSENLFNTDSKMEFMYIHSFTGANGYGNFITYIYNEDGDMLFSDTSAAFVHPHWEMQQYPIYNTSIGTKMLLSCVNGQAKVFSLPGKLTTAINQGNQSLLNSSNLVSNPYPNPATNSTRIDYTFPAAVNQGEIVFYDLQGKELRRYKVDRAFDHLLISTADIAAGTYFYQLQTSGLASAGKKMVVIK